MNKKEIEEKLSEGHIHFNTIIEIVGKPKEHIQQTIKDYVKAIEDNENYTLIKKHVARAKKTDDDMFSVYAELDILTKEIQGVLAFCFNYMPASIEIIEPSELIFDNVEMTNVVNELQAKLHEVDMIAKQVNQKNVHMNENINAILTNFVNFTCSIPRTSEDIAKITGLKKDVIIPFLTTLINNGKLKKDKDKYYI